MVVWAREPSFDRDIQLLRLLAYNELKSKTKILLNNVFQPNKIVCFSFSTVKHCAVVVFFFLHFLTTTATNISHKTKIQYV